MRAKDCEIAIIGSGFGGSVCALRAAEAGRDVVVLERGPRIGPDFHEEMASGRRPFHHSSERPGLLEIHRLRGLSALTGNGVGGGSQVYTAVTVPPPPEIFDESWSRDLSYDMLVPHFDKVCQMIRPSVIPRALPRTLALESAGQKLGTDVTRLPVAIDWPDDLSKLGETPAKSTWQQELALWLRGGHATRKRTLDKTYLGAAEAAGAKVCPLHEAITIVPELPGYRVHYREFRNDCWMDGSLHARRLVIAAGTLNTIRLLLTCRDTFKTLPDLSTVLGNQFHTNGDFGGVILCPAFPRDSGPPVTAWVDCWKDDRIYLMELGLMPPLPWLIGKGLELYTGMKGLAGRSGLAPLIIGVMGFDRNASRISLNSGGVLECVGRHDEAGEFQKRTLSRLRDLASAMGGKLLLPPNSMIQPGHVTVHPLGGARMADNPASGVVNSSGEVFGYPGLFIADGSILPTPTGAAPSMTIAALAEHVSRYLVST
jgi:cholesterol oxidase